jgi:hypothetical protein
MAKLGGGPVGTSVTPRRTHRARDWVESSRDAMTGKLRAAPSAPLRAVPRRVVAWARRGMALAIDTWTRT